MECAQIGPRWDDRQRPSHAAGPRSPPSTVGERSALFSDSRGRRRFAQWRPAGELHDHLLAAMTRRAKSPGEPAFPDISALASSRGR